MARGMGLVAGFACVLALALAAPAWAEPTIVVEPYVAKPGNEATIAASGFAPGGQINCVLSADGLALGHAKVRPTGAFSIQVEIPPSARPGNRAVECGPDAVTGIIVQPRYEVTAIGPLPGDDTSGATDVNAVGQATVKSKTSAPASDNGAVWSGGELDPIGTGGVFPNAINDHAFVAGTTKPSSFDFDAFLCQFRAGACSGGLFDLGGLGGTSSFANDINRTGMVVGASDLPGDSARHAAVCNNPTCTGGMRDLGTLGGDASLAEGVNDARLVVGGAATAGGAQHAFSCPYRPGIGACAGGMDDLGTLGGTASTAHDVSGNGVVVGDSQTTGNAARHAFLDDGVMHDLQSLPGATNSFAYGVNDDELVVGNTSDHSFIWGSDRMFQLDRFARPRWDIRDASAINDYGQIAATGSSGGGDRGLILSPLNLVGSVAITDTGYEPSTVKVLQGGVVQWVNTGAGNHSVADTSGLNRFSSGQLHSGVGYASVINTAGRYPAQDIPRGLIGQVAVPMEAAPDVGGPNKTFQLYLSAGEPPPNGLFDVRVKPPGQPYQSLVTGVGVPALTFTPQDGPGEYRFVARLHDYTTDFASGWSPPATITVEP